MPEPPAPARQRVLVVDDVAEIRALIEINLELEGYDVVTAADGRECLDRVAEIRPDLITLDVAMPGLDGFHTAAELRARPDTAHIPLVLLTARAQGIDRRRGHHLGVGAYITKPFEPDDLVRAVRSLIPPRRGAPDQ